MKNKDAKELIDELLDLHVEISNRVKNHILPLSGEQKKWKPSSERWSIFECLSHLNRFYQYYIPTIGKRMVKKSNLEPVEKFNSSHIGRTLYKSMKLNKAGRPRRKLKSPRNYNPKLNPELVTGNDDKEFLENQEHFKELLQGMNDVNLRKIKIPLSISKVVKIRLGDALPFLIFHNERHIQQALNIIEHPKFPSK